MTFRYDEISLGDLVISAPEFRYDLLFSFFAIAQCRAVPAVPANRHTGDDFVIFFQFFVGQFRYWQFGQGGLANE